jgi:hypothetical protein
MWRWTESEEAHRSARVVACAECGCLSGLRWAGWRAHRIDDPELDEPPALAFFCPACADREFGGRR